MESRLPPVKERKGVSFTELEDFFRLVILKKSSKICYFFWKMFCSQLSHLDDFSLAFRLYPRAGRSLSKKEFAR